MADAQRRCPLLAFGLLAVLLPMGMQAQSKPDAPRQQKPKLPDTMAAKRLSALVDAINKGTDEAFQRFANEHVDEAILKRNPDAVSSFLRNAHTATGGLLIHRVEESTAEGLTVLARAKKKPEDWVYPSVQVSPEAPHRMNRPPRVEPAPPPK
jgi:hypothetical protein